MTEDPDQGALEELRRHQEAAGMTFEDPDAPVHADPETSWKDEEYQ